MQCIILAGGLAERMRPLTERIPKSMLPVGPHPFIHYQLQWMGAHGVREAVLCVGHLGEQIRDYVGQGERWGLRVRYVDESSQLRGTGGALRLAFDQGVLEPVFLVTYGDSFLPIDFAGVARAFDAAAAGAGALMTVFRNQGRWDTSNVCFARGQVLRYDKARRPSEHGPYEYIDYGLSVMTRDTVSCSIPSGQRYDLADLFHRLSQEGRLAGAEVHTRFYEIGSREGLEDFTRYIADSVPAPFEAEPPPPESDLTF
jgi:NDP-sugar pyrophosphorylase family protein